MLRQRLSQNPKLQGTLIDLTFALNFTNGQTAGCEFASDPEATLRNAGHHARCTCRPYCD